MQSFVAINERAIAASLLSLIAERGHPSLGIGTSVVFSRVKSYDGSSGVSISSIAIRLSDYRLTDIVKTGTRQLTRKGNSL
jgi:hypothetical protein